jgi:hypothetical protein
MTLSIVAVTLPSDSIGAGHPAGIAATEALRLGASITAGFCSLPYVGNNRHRERFRVEAHGMAVTDYRLV